MASGLTVLHQTQIERHVELRYCTDRKPLVYEYGKNGSKGMSIEKATRLCQVLKTHAPMIFLDKSGTRPLPPADFLAMFQVVITTTSRFMNESKNGSFQQEIERLDVGEDIPAWSSFSASDKACPLLKVHWLRMIVDEGHSMGKDKENSTIEFASWISAERRWAMSGTPTKQSAAQIGQLLGLMRFLKHNFFTLRLDGDTTWKNSVSKCWRDGHLAAFFRLRSLLGFLMSRHTKLDIAELPPPHFTTTAIPMSSTEVSTYNTLVSGAQSNLLITSMKGKTSGEQDSLLHRSQAQHARKILVNIRRVCVGWTRVISTLSEKHLIEFFHLLQDRHNLPEEKINELRRFIHDAETGDLSECSCCSMRLSVLLVQPCCGGLICTECMDNKTVTCFICGKGFDIDEFQELQPGFEIVWKSNLENLKEKPSPPQRTVDPIVLPAVPEGDAAMSRNVILRPPQELRGTRKYGDGHACEYSHLVGDGLCVLCSKEHEPCNLVNEHSRCEGNLVNEHSRCEFCFKIAKDCPEDESKSSYLVSKLLKLYWAHGNRHVSPPNPAEFPKCDSPRPLKAIVFSQFRKALDFVGDRMIRRFGTACVAEYWGKYRVPELHKFVHDPACFCMLLSNDGSEGLDLSFVTHIFFLEEVWDKSLSDQAVARAWRMGAKERVEVETLVAKNSVEETMQEFESAVNERSVGNVDAFESLQSSLIGTNSTEYLRTKTHTLLRTLRLNTDYHRFSQTGESDEAPKTKMDHSPANVLLQSQSAASEELPPRKKARTARVRFLDL
jgi:SNF2 family DNA or RNA helicase